MLTENGKPITPDMLNYGDKMIIRYAGKDLKARQMERTSQATFSSISPPSLFYEESLLPSILSYSSAVALGAIALTTLLVIAGSDRLFRGTVPLEQRLVSHNTHTCPPAVPRVFPRVGVVGGGGGAARARLLSLSLPLPFEE